MDLVAAWWCSITLKRYFSCLTIAAFFAPACMKQRNFGVEEEGREKQDATVGESGGVGGEGGGKDSLLP